MTPALLLALYIQRKESLSISSLPVDKLTWAYLNQNRPMGEYDDKGNQIKPPADPIDFELVRSFSNKKGTLAAKDDPKWDASLYGAKANREAFDAWAGAKLRPLFIPKGK